MRADDYIENLQYFVGRVCTIHTRPTNWKHNQEQNLDYFMGVVDSIDPLGIRLTNVLNSKKTFLFLESVIAVAEETVVDPDDPSQVKAVEEYEAKKKALLEDNPNISPRKSPLPPPPPPAAGGCGSSCGSSFVDIKGITEIAQTARDKMKAS